MDLSSRPPIYQVSLPALFTANEKGSLTPPASLPENKRLPSELVRHILIFCKTPKTLFNFLLLSKQFYVVAMSDPFVRLVQTVFKVNQASPQGDLQVNSQLLHPFSSLMNFNFQTLKHLNIKEGIVEKIFLSTPHFFMKSFGDKFCPLLNIVKWNPKDLQNSADEKVQAIAKNHLAFCHLLNQPLRKWQESLRDGTIDWNQLYQGANDPNAPKHSLYHSAQEKLEALMRTLSSSIEDRPHILNILRLHGLAVKDAPNSIKADLEAAFIAVEQNGLALRYLDPELVQNQRPLVLTAVRQNGLAYETLVTHCYDLEILATAIYQQPAVLEKLSPKQQSLLSFYSLKQLARELLQIDPQKLACPAAIQNPLLQKCVEAMAQLPNIREIKDKEKRQQAMAACAKQWSLMTAKSLTKLLSMYHQRAGSLHEDMLSNVRACLIDKPCPTFSVDLRQAILGKYLHGTSTNGILKRLEWTGDSDYIPDTEWNAYFKHLLTFFLKSMELDPLSPACLEVLNHLDGNEHNSFTQMEILFDLLDFKIKEKREEIQSILIKKGMAPQQAEQMAWQEALAGPLKLSPLLKAFNRISSLEIQARMLTLNRFLEGSNRREGIVMSCRSLPDSETKSLTFSFQNGEILITVKRLGHLRTHPHCFIQSQVNMRASFGNLSEWEIEAFVDIKRPAGGNHQFEEDYAKLLDLIDLMGLPYQESCLD